MYRKTVRLRFSINSTDKFDYATFYRLNQNAVRFVADPIQNAGGGSAAHELDARAGQHGPTASHVRAMSDHNAGRIPFLSAGPADRGRRTTAGRVAGCWSPDPVVLQL